MTPDAEQLGRYRYDIATDSWWWSDELYRIYGFTPGEVVPTGALILAHTHPEDFEPAATLLSTAVAHGGQFSLRHRMIDTNNRIHTVMSVGEAVTDTEGTVTGLVGFVSDLTHSERLAVAHAVGRAVTEFLEHQSLIEQAKGVLRGEFGCDADEAFELIKWRSQHTNSRFTKVASRFIGLPDPTEQRSQVQGSSWARCPTPSDPGKPSAGPAAIHSTDGQPVERPLSRGWSGWPTQTG